MAKRQGKDDPADPVDAGIMEFCRLVARILRRTCLEQESEPSREEGELPETNLPRPTPNASRARSEEE